MKRVMPFVMFVVMLIWMPLQLAAHEPIVGEGLSDWPSAGELEGVTLGHVTEVEEFEDVPLPQVNYEVVCRDIWVRNLIGNGQGGNLTVLITHENGTSDFIDIEPGQCAKWHCSWASIRVLYAPRPGSTDPQTPYGIGWSAPIAGH